jgi:hypothetical protein
VSTDATIRNHATPSDAQMAGKWRQRCQPRQVLGNPNVHFHEQLKTKRVCTNPKNANATTHPTRTRHTLGVLEVVSPERTNLVLTSNVPHCK